MTTNACIERWDVAGYALGVLDDEDSTRFENHLATCVWCADELDSLMPVAGMLAEVDRAAFVRAEESAKDPRMLSEMLNTVAYRRSKTNVRMLALAASVVAVMIVVGLALVLSNPGSNNSGRNVVAGQNNTLAPQGGGNPTPSASASVAAPAIGGPGNDDIGEHLAATDATTGVRLDVLVAAKPWGTQLSFAVTNVHGPLRCRMVTVEPNGTTEVVSSWQVPPDGYGTPQHPEPLTLQAHSALAPQQMARVEIQTIDATGTATRLVAVSMN
jgi:hypothetical protein